MNRKSCLMLIGLILIASAGMAQESPQLPNDRVVTELKPTKLGDEKFEAFGVAAKFTQNGVQRFVAKVFAKCPDGDILVVRGILNDGKAIDLGSIEMLLDSGVLELKSSKDPSDAFPLDKLRVVSVDHKEGMILTGVFDR